MIQVSLRYDLEHGISVCALDATPTLPRLTMLWRDMPNIVRLTILVLDYRCPGTVMLIIMLNCAAFMSGGENSSE